MQFSLEVEPQPRSTKKSVKIILLNLNYHYLLILTRATNAITTGTASRVGATATRALRGGVTGAISTARSDASSVAEPVMGKQKSDRRFRLN